MLSRAQLWDGSETPILILSRADWLVACLKRYKDFEICNLARVDEISRTKPSRTYWPSE